MKTDPSYKSKAPSSTKSSMMNVQRQKPSNRNGDESDSKSEEEDYLVESSDSNKGSDSEVKDRKKRYPPKKQAVP